MKLKEKLAEVYLDTCSSESDPDTIRHAYLEAFNMARKMCAIHHEFSWGNPKYSGLDLQYAWPLITTDINEIGEEDV